MKYTRKKTRVASILAALAPGLVVGGALAFGQTVCNVPPATPQPNPTPTFNRTSSVSGGQIVFDATDKSDQRTNSFSFRNGETTYSLVTPRPTPVGSVTPCPTPTWQPQFTPEPVSPAGKKALVLVYGEPTTYDNATFYFSNNNGDMVSTFVPSSTIPADPAIPASVISMANGFTVPTGMKAGYFTLSFPDGVQAQFFSFHGTKNGHISYKVWHETVGTVATNTFTVTSQKVTIRPRIKFTANAGAPNAFDCSGAVTVTAVDGNGAIVTPYSGDDMTLALSGTNFFEDADCIYNVSKLGITNTISTPCPSPMQGLTARPPTTCYTDHITFYYMSKVAGTLPISVSYQEAGGYTTSLNETVNPLPPVSLEVTGPASVNQGACSNAFKGRLLDKFGNETQTVAARDFAFNGSGGAAYFSDSSCSSRISVLHFPAGTSQQLFYILDPSAASVPVSLVDPGNVIVQSGKPPVLRVLSMSTVAGAKDPATAQQMAIRLYDRLVGVPIALTDPNLAKMTNLILAGKILDAADIATQQKGFYDITLKNMVTPLSNRMYNSLDDLNDFVTTWIGIVRDNHDARELLTGTHIYVDKSIVDAATAKVNGEACLPYAGPQSDTPYSVYRSNDAFVQLQDDMAMSGKSLKDALTPVQECAYNTLDFGSVTPTALAGDAGGLLTTHAWGKAHLFMGTNRRSIAFAFDVFMCRNIRDVADNQAPDWHIRRDVDRAPGGDPKVYTASCRSCHGGMDALAGAFAFFDAYDNPDDSSDFRLFHVPPATYADKDKNNINSGVFPPGWITGDDSWINLWTDGKNQSLGWSSDVPLKGNGPGQLGNMLANSQAFPACMAQRVFKEVCKRDPADTDYSALDDLSQDFQASGYNMRRLFEKAASLSSCLGNGR